MAASLHANTLSLSLIASVAYRTLASDFGAARTLGEDYVNANVVKSGSGRVTSRTVNLPAELLLKYTTMEYALSRPAQVHPILLYVIATCMDKDDFKALRATAHELGYDQCPNSSVFRGTKWYAPKQIQEILGLTAATAAIVPRPGAPGPSQSAPAAAGNQPLGAALFLLPVSPCEFQLITKILEQLQLQRQPWPLANDKRAQCCSGMALSVAEGMLETSFPNTGVRVMLFIGGDAWPHRPSRRQCAPSRRSDELLQHGRARQAVSHARTWSLVSTELCERIRSHHDIDKDNNVNFYDVIAKRAAPDGYTIEWHPSSLPTSSTRTCPVSPFASLR
ncbi:hypothetical protein V8E36_006751 [Tilletia maclaganii]